jgi:hypothetical protein
MINIYKKFKFFQMQQVLITNVNLIKGDKII